MRIETPEVVNLYKTKGWEDDPQCVYVGRAGKGLDGYYGNPIKPEAGKEPGSTLPAFEIYARERIKQDPKYRERIKRLAGKRLVCFCAPKPCHGDVLARLCVELNGWDPEKDGIDHINVYSKGLTKLGRRLSNFYQRDIETEDGWFMSVEGYWYWLSAHEESDREPLRKMSGLDAKKYGRELRAADYPKIVGFKKKIRAAIWNKIDCWPELQEQMLANDLPYAHYYVYGGKVVEPSEGEWVIKFIEKSAAFLKENR